MKLNYFNFKKLGDQVLLTNDFGSHLFVSPAEFVQILSKEVDLESDIGRQLLEKNMIYAGTSLEYSTFMKHDLRRIKGHVNVATSLHIFVVTTACNMGCAYCQANGEAGRHPLLMSKDVAEKAVDVSLQSPARFLTFEFQGGEPLLNFEMVKHIVLYAEARKGEHEISYSIVSNLTLLTDEMLDFFVEHGFGVSTSIDGPEFVHDRNRPFKSGSGTFGQTADAIRRIREKGLRVGAIQTTTRAALPYPREIVRTYRDLGFDSIFIRPLTPLGRAAKGLDDIGYDPGDFVSFYEEALDELIQINRAGRFLKEDHASILLSRIEGRFVNYMELRSPCGAGVGQLAFHADGDVFTCDEGRMLHEMGDHAFRLGNVFEDTYSDMVSSGVCRAVCASSILEAIPGCCDCVYQPYCGVCPVVTYAKCQDIIEKEPRGFRCRIFSGMLDYLFGKLQEGDASTVAILESWSN